MQGEVYVVRTRPPLDLLDIFESNGAPVAAPEGPSAQFDAVLKEAGATKPERAIRQAKARGEQWLQRMFGLYFKCRYERFNGQIL